MVSLCIYICIYMYVNVNVHVHVHVLYLYLYIQSMGNRWKGPVGGSPTIPTHSPTIGYDSPTITTSGSWVEGEPVFWWKKNRFTKRIQFGRQNHPLTALTVDPFGNKVVEMSFFGAWSQKDLPKLAGRWWLHQRWQWRCVGGTTSLRFFVLQKQRLLQCGDWNLIP